MARAHTDGSTPARWSERATPSTHGQATGRGVAFEHMLECRHLDRRSAHAEVDARGPGSRGPDY